MRGKDLLDLLTNATGWNVLKRKQEGIFFQVPFHLFIKPIYKRSHRGKQHIANFFFLFGCTNEMDEYIRDGNVIV